MSLHIEIWKINEDDQMVTYSFGTSSIFKNKPIGTAIIYKENGEVQLTEQLDQSVEKDKLLNFFLSRIKAVLNYHRDNGVYPNRTDSPTLRVE
jgi:hypothetical protein